MQVGALTIIRHVDSIAADLERLVVQRLVDVAEEVDNPLQRHLLLRARDARGLDTRGLEIKSLLASVRQDLRKPAAEVHIYANSNATFMPSKCANQFSPKLDCSPTKSKQKQRQPKRGNEHHLHNWQ